MAVLTGLHAPASPMLAQTHEIASDVETFRKTPEGTRLADLLPGMQVDLVGTRGEWAEVRLSGWVPAAALSTTDREGHDRIVVRVGGLTLHDVPEGEVIARLLQGFLLDHEDDRDDWSRVSRSGWVRLVSLRPVSVDERLPDPEAVDRPPPIVAEGRRLMTGAVPLEMQAAPGGDTVAVVRPGTPITVVERGNEWTRIRMDGWVRSDRLITSEGDSAVVVASAGALKASPDEYRGMRVRWTVQFVSLERAEPERTDFYEGEPFILARAPDPGDGLVYVAVPPELLSAAEELRPLEMIDILAEVRTGRSSLLGVPVLDLLALF